jgi:hypothetical protein
LLRFFLHLSSFEPFWIRIRIPNADPDQGDQLNADPCGSGSETLVETKTFFSFSQKLFVFAKVFAKIGREIENFREIFRLRISFLRKDIAKILHFKVNFSACTISCLICFETLSGFDPPVAYIYNNTAVSFVLKQDPDLFWTSFASWNSDVSRHFRFPRNFFSLKFRFRESFHLSFPENFRYFRNFT